MGDDPPFLSVGTEVSAKYKGAFCEAKVRKVVKSIKCKVMFKLGLGSAVVSDEQIKGLLRVGAQVEAKHPEKAQFLEGIISKIQDCSQYTVVFDDGDITTLRRTALCLKSGRHFAESETLDQLPLTHPEHFGTPVLGGRRGRRRDDSSDDEGDASSEPGRKEQSGGCKRTEDREPDIGKIVCVEISDKKKGKEPWFPGLIVAPTAQDAVSIRVKDEYLVRSFKDARYYTVPKKEALEFTREIALKTEINTLKAAIEKAVLYLDRDELPAHWDREVLFGLDDSSSLNESKAGSDPDSSDDETREEKDHFVAQLYKFMDDSGTPINKAPTINNRDLDLYRLFKIVHKLGGFNRVTNQNAWKAVTQKMILATASNSSNLLKQAYKKYLHGFEEFYRKLGCTMNSPRGPKSRSRPGRSLIRDRDRASGSLTPKCDIDDDEKPKAEVKVEKVDKVEEVSAAVSPPTSAATAAAAAVGAVVEEAVAKAEAKEKEETLPPQKKKERPSRLSEKKAPVKEESDENDQENESGSSHSVRSQRGTRSRKPEGELTPEPNRNRRKTKSKAEDKTNEEEEKPVPHVKVEEEAAVTNGKEAAVEKKSKTPLRENKMKAAKKNESEVKTPHGDDSKKAESLPAAEEVRPPPKRRGRKPKALLESEEAMTRRDSQVINEINDFREETGHLAPNVDVQIGDRLKIYFDKQDSNVTYEAKVCEIRNEGTSKVYLVHYTGWNTRYDEWVKRTRIAENLTWTPNRKRNKSAQGGPSAQSSSTSGSSSVKIGPAKRGRTKGRDSSRSATPSSVTSTSSTGQRNASQLSGEETSGKQPPCKANRRRSRRISEMSAVSTESLGFSDDDEEEDNDDQGIRRRKKPAKKSTAESEESEAIEVDDSEMTPRRRRRRRQISETEEMLTEMKNLPAELPAEEVVSATPTAAAAAVATSTSTPTSSTTAPAPGPTTSVPTVTTPVRRGRRRALPLPEATGESPAKIVASSAPEKEEEALAVKIPESSTNDLNQHPGEDSKGTDFDLKKIRSELKIPADIAAATAAPPAAPPSAVAATATVSGAAATTAGGGMTTSVASMSPSSAPQQPGCLSPGMKGSDDDVYEFREPEPFEFEVRARRESPFSEEKVHRFVHKNKEKEEENSPKKPSPSSPQHANPAEKIKAAITVTTPPRTRPSLSVTSVPTATTLDNHPHHPESAQPESPPPPPPPPTIEPPSTTLSAQNSPRPVVSAEDVSVEDVQDSAKTAGLFTPISPASATAPSILPQVTNSDLSSPPTQISDSPVVTAPAAVTTTTTSTTTTPAAVIATITTTTTTVVSVVAATAVATTPEAVVSLGSAPQLELKEEPASVIVSTIAEDCKSKSPLKRERRKTNKKAISREFIESDEDSPEDVRTSDVKLEVDSEEKPSGDSDHCETAEEEKSEEVNPASVIVDNVPKPGSSSYSLPKAKLDEDLDENLLLCEETIPGSPVTYSSSSASVADCPDGAVSHPVASTSRSTVEMPFASAPASSNSPRTRGLTGGANPGARTSRKRGLRQALAMQRPIRCASGGSAVMENTPPTTPDGSLSSSSNSPQGDNGSFSPEHEGSIKSERDFSENDNQMAASLQVPPGPPSRNVGPRASATLPTPNLPNPLPPPATVKRREEETVAKEEESPVKKRKRGTGSDQCSRRGRGHGRSPRRTGSDSEETTSEFMNSSGVSGCVTLTSYQPRSTRYNFCTDLDPDMDASQRIVFLQEKLRDLRQTYSALKAQLVLIDRRRKKLKRKEKDPSF